jgi:Ca-activated chloride channel homolog
MSFYYPWFLPCIPFIFLIGYVIKNKRRYYGFRFSSINPCPKSSSLRVRAASNLVYLRCAVLSLLILAAARPQTPIDESLKRSNAVDIILAVDVSESMRAEDMGAGDKRKNRIDAVKEALSGFIFSRKNDRIAMVIFATKAFIASPPTFNHAWLLKRVKALEIGIIEGRQTAIGSGLAVSLNRLKNSNAKSKIIILLTDGRNNAGDVSPETAAGMANALDVKVYTIGVGSFGSALLPVFDKSGKIAGYDSVKVDIDEPLLRRIAEDTHARYFRVTDMASLKGVYKEIDRMERSHIEEKAYDDYNELFGWFLIAGLLLLLFEMVLANTFLRRIP